MTTKLTLTLDDKVIKSAKKYAKASGRSVSDLVENYLKLLTAPSTEKLDMSPSLRSLMGSFKAPADFDFDYKKVLRDEKSRKFE